tara:strand:+ start:291 stop:473 length:183 start_codon:yes stop_codon:yes gene_type:complete
MTFHIEKMKSLFENETIKKEMVKNFILEFKEKIRIKELKKQHFIDSELYLKKNNGIIKKK